MLWSIIHRIPSISFAPQIHREHVRRTLTPQLSMGQIRWLSFSHHFRPSLKDDLAILLAKLVSGRKTRRIKTKNQRTGSTYISTPMFKHGSVFQQHRAYTLAGTSCHETAPLAPGCLLRNSAWLQEKGVANTHPLQRNDTLQCNWNDLHPPASRPSTTTTTTRSTVVHQQACFTTVRH